MTIDDALRTVELEAELHEQHHRTGRAERLRDAHRVLAQAAGVMPTPVHSPIDDPCPACGGELVPTGRPGLRRCADCQYEVTR